MFFLCTLNLLITDIYTLSSYHLVKEQSLSQTTELPAPYAFPTGILLPLGLYPLTFQPSWWWWKAKHNSFCLGISSLCIIALISLYFQLGLNARSCSLLLCLLYFILLAILLVTKSCLVSSLWQGCGMRALIFHAWVLFPLSPNPEI